MKRILFVDDDADLSLLIGKLLGEFGYDMVCVDSAEAALAQLKIRTFDLVITDMCMPTMSGIQLCSIIKKTFENLKVILVTGFGGMAAAMEAINAGAFDFIVKPFDVDQINSIINNTFVYN